MYVYNNFLVENLCIHTCLLTNKLSFPPCYLVYTVQFIHSQMHDKIK